jgi:hypothetical protein
VTSHLQTENIVPATDELKQATADCNPVVRRAGGRLQDGKLQGQSSDDSGLAMRVRIRGVESIARREKG